MENYLVLYSNSLFQLRTTRLRLSNYMLVQHTKPDSSYIINLKKNNSYFLK